MVFYEIAPTFLQIVALLRHNNNDIHQDTYDRGELFCS